MIMKPRDHLNHSARTVLLHTMQLLLQLNLPDVKLDPEIFMSAFSATIDGVQDCRPDPWKYAPLAVPLEPPVRGEDGRLYSPTELFPFRSEMLDTFLDKLHIPHASRVPDIALKGVLADFPPRLEIRRDEVKSTGMYLSWWMYSDIMLTSCCPGGRLTGRKGTGTSKQKKNKKKRN